MATAKSKRYGRIERGDKIPYGTLADASPELRQAYYYHGYMNDDDMPPVPCPPPDLSESYVCPEEELFKKEMAQILNDMLDGLARREAKVLRLRFGFDSNYDLTLDEIGRTFDVGRERIRQIEAKALRKLKHPTRFEALHGLVEPKCQEDKIIQAKRDKEQAEKHRLFAREMAEEMYMRKKRFDATVYKETDTTWLDYVKRVEPELYAMVMARADKILEQYT